MSVQMLISTLSRAIGRKNLVRDQRGMAAMEFALLFPFMILLFFGTIQVSDGVAVDRKVSILARTLSDLISQASTVTSTDFSNAYLIGASVMNPYPGAPVQAKITQLYIDSNTGTPKVVWSTASNTNPHACGESITVPSGIAVKGKYLIMAEVSYSFTPAAGFDSQMRFTPPAFNLSDKTFTRPRQTDSVTYNNSSGQPIACS
jgi:Flp pilus assembly protein TadG